MEQTDTIVAPDEAKAEEEALAEANHDQIRADIVSSLGLEENDDNREFIDKLVERDKSHRTRLSEAIGQKINWRKRAQEGQPPAQPPSTETTTETKSYDPEEVRKQAETAALTALEQRDLDEMEYSDEIKAEIKKVAQLQGVSVRKAANDPYIQHQIAEFNADNRTTEATVTPTPKSTTAKSDAPPKFDMSTEEGRKEYEEWKNSKKE